MSIHESLVGSLQAIPIPLAFAALTQLRRVGVDDFAAHIFRRRIAARRRPINTLFKVTVECCIA